MGDEKKRPVIDKDTCTGCGICVDECPNSVLEVVNDIAEVQKPESCDGCGKCAEACPNEAIKME